MYDTYIVESNDTWDSIAKKYNTTPIVLAELNNNQNLVPGTMVMVPRFSSQYFDYYKISKGDTLYKIATDLGINPSLLAQLNGLNQSDYIYPDQVLLIPKAGSILYISAIGDTLEGIANGIGTDIESLIAQNKNIYLQPEQLIVYKRN